MATTFSELWLEIEGAAASAVAAVKSEIASIENQIVPVIEADLVLALSQLKDIAIAAVLDAAKMAISGEEKLSTVVTTVFQHAEANAIAVGIEDVRLLAQQAYHAVAKAVGAL